MSEVEIRAPAEQTEGTRSQILKWLKAVGESVSENEPLVEIETDKVTVEVAAPGTGVLREILKHEQDEIEPGELLGRIGAEAGATASGTQGVGQQSQSVGGRSAMAQPDAIARPVGAKLDAGAHPVRAQSDATPPPQSPVNATQLSPAVRRLLVERGLDPSSIQGSGQGGRITVQDVMQQGAASRPAPVGGSDPAVRKSGAGAPAVDQQAPEGVGESRLVPHSAVRKRIAEHMVQSLLHTAPHVTTVFEADLTAVLDHRQLHKDEFAEQGAQLTLTAYFLRAAVAAIRAVPEANSRFTDSALQIFDSIHIGIATALDTGLVVPVLRNVQSLDLFGIAQGLEQLVARARNGELSPADVRGGTFTISNHGVSGSLVATPIIINQPQSAILGIGKLEKRPVVLTDGNGEERLGIQPRCYVTLTIDHRVMDGHQANRFLKVFVQTLATAPS